MTRTVLIILALTVICLGQPTSSRAAPPPAEVGGAIPSYPQPLHELPGPAPRPPFVWDAPTPPVPPGSYWEGAMVPVAHQRVLYYPGWDDPCRVLKGKPLVGVPALDVWQGAVPVYWKRLGQ